MTTVRKPAATREKEFKLAIFRIERGRSNTKAKKLSIAAVAREVGVTPALIHNEYPKVAEAIRAKLGASSRQRRDEKQEQLKQALEKNRELTRQLKAAEKLIAMLASINEVQLLENKTLRASDSGSRVIRIQ